MATLVTPTPADHGEHYHCGTLVGGGLTNAVFAGEQTRGTYRGDVLLGVLITALLLVAALLGDSRVRRAVLGLLAVGALFMLAYTGVTLFGERLTERWVALFSGLLAVIPAVAVWQVLRAGSQAART